MAARGVKFEDPSEKEKKDEKSHSRDKVRLSARSKPDF
jgi:hypothetical protein